MYSPDIVARKLEMARQELGWALEYHSTSEVDTFEAGLWTKYEDAYHAAEASASGSQFPAREFQLSLSRELCSSENPRLSPDEMRWILNERYLSMCDSAYWMTRYFKIKNIHNDIQRFTFRPAQRIYFDIVAELESKGLSIELLIDKARQLGVCLSPETRVLTADLRWVTLDDIKPGQEIVSVDEEAPGGRGKGRKLRRALVLSKSEVQEPAFRLELSNGESLVATAPHRFLCKHRGTKGWRKVRDICVGDYIRYVTRPWANPNYEDGWFGGMLDGEGSLCTRKKEGGVEACVSQTLNVAYLRAYEYLESRGYTFHRDLDNRKSADSSKLGDQPVAKLVVNRINEVFRLIGQTRPARFTNGDWWEGRGLPGSKSGVAWAKVVYVGYLPKQRMIDLQTSTKTFIAEGFVSHNSTETAGFIGHRAFFTYGASATLASFDQSKTAEMANMLFLGYDLMPWHMRPLHTRRVESDRGMLVFGGQRSSVKFQHGTQAGGISQGTTPTVYHLCVAGKTLVRVSDGRVLPMREVRAGGTVISPRGKFIRVKSAWESPRTSEITSDIRVWGTPSDLSVTRDHMVKTLSGWKEAKDITSRDWLVYPIREISDGASVTLRRYKAHARHKYAVKDFDPTFALGRLCGLYLAEGCLFYSRYRTALSVGYALHQREESQVRAWTEEVFGPNQRATQRRKTSKTIVVMLSDRGFAEWLGENFGVKDEKRVPDFCWDLGREFCRGLVFGYLFGDGHFASRDNSVYATSVRVSIPIGLREMLVSLGYGWSQIAYREAGIWYNRNCQAAWILAVSSDTAVAIRRDFGEKVHNYKRDQEPLHWKWTEEGVAVSVEANVDGFSEDFYDLEVDDPDHAFLTACGIVHNSEVAYYPDPEALIEVGLFKAVHPSPKVLGVLESTACGDTGWWPDKYWYYKRKWPNCRMLALFLPWFLGTDLYPNTTWLRKSPIPRNWTPRDETREMQARAELYVKSNAVLESVLGAGWSLPREQAWWWEVQYNEALDGGKVKTFLQEYPTDDQESFQGSYESVFGRETIATVYSKRETSYKVFGIVGQSIETKNEPMPDDVDYDSPRVPVVYQSPRGDTYRWELIPLRWREDWSKLSDIREVEIPNGMLMTFRDPEPGYDYSLGVDTSTGIGDEATVLAMARRSLTGQEPDIQVAEFRSNQVSHVEAYPYAMCLAAYYAKHMVTTTRFKEPYVSIEQVQAVGDTVYKDMWRMGYSRFHRMIRYDSKPKDSKRSKAHKTGWFTNAWSRPILTDNFVVAVQNGWYIVNSPWTIWEMQHWETHLTVGGKEKKVHSSESTDDGIFANAMAWLCPNDLRSLTERTQKRCMGPDSEGSLPPLDVGEYGAKISPKGIAADWRSNLEGLR